MTHPGSELTRLGDALERAAAADLARGRPAAQGRRIRRRLLVVAAAAAVAIPGAAIATHLITNDEVAASMPAGAAELAGTNPTCTVVSEGVEYHCVLENPPDVGVQDYMGFVFGTVDATKHVNGGCRSLRADGLEWRCYLGEEAVRQEIIGASFLGEEVLGPGRG